MTVTVIKATQSELAHVQTLLDEYYAALEIVKRDTSHHTRDFLELSCRTGSSTGCWVAYDGIEPVGCVVLRSLDAAELELARIPNDKAGECKRLYVRTTHRGQGIADLMLDKLESFAKTRAVDWMFLDSKDDLVGALKLYSRRDYTPCARYNDNPQATVFMKLRLS